MNHAKLIGIGVGPGDPELMTLKAVRLIEESPVIAVPAGKKEDSVAYRIALLAVKDLDKKECLCIEMPMTKDKEKLKESHRAGAEQIKNCLLEGKQVAFLTLGDPTVYSTYIYLHKRIGQMGFETEIVSGITSFCAAAARLNEGLVEKAEQLHVIPASYQVEEALKLPGTKVLMKAGKKLSKVKELLLAHKQEAVMIENCGMPGERICYGAENFEEDAGYYTLMIVKEKNE